MLVPLWRRTRQGGVAAVEFALVALVFFLFLFAMMEVARAVYLWNTVQEITRRAARAAAVANFADAGAMQRLRQQAVFRDSPGRLVMGGAITDSYVRIDYLSLPGGAAQPVPLGALPGCPARNLVNCINDPNGASCIRFVRASLCLPDGPGGPNGAAGACRPVPYQPIVPMVGMLFPAGVSLPTGATVAVAESLGYRPGMALCL
ncbi:TadE family protein [Janthinobacterium agaricidamnosum]|uniref:TadE-like family protein n=1 Tax=Janthinobacterium agaricidamnosum NBRC 102515 = DSM 9628 TaxID=1349767 RepID=W0VE55_9BURK|nr:TadE family protein [Janthinobacterium agaricidamnosum]CDG85698.1 tadE-like family protein [Janthinobacterium agaricidamnosum NBRC 102515 = DSM 9628]